MCYTSLHSCLLRAPSAQQLNDASEHLRFWPYVKAFRKLDDKTIEVILCIGKFTTLAQQSYFLSRSRDLILLCLRQYGIKMGRWFIEENFTPNYTSDLFLRPDEKLQALSSIITSVDQNSKQIPF